MTTRPLTLGRTGLRISSLAFGTMSFGGRTDAATAARIFGMCRDAGINLFDTADVYNGGRAEQMLGDLVKGCRDQVIIASKGHFPTGQGPNDRGSSRYHIVQAVEASLRRLQTDRIDIYFLHRFDEHTPLEESLETLDMLVKQGKILYPAVSNFAAWQVVKARWIADVRKLVPIVAIQPMYNLLKRQAEVELFPMALDAGLGVMPYSPLGAGMLAGLYGPDVRPLAGRPVDDPRYRIRYGASHMLEVAGAFTELAADVGLHPVTLAIAWAGHHPAVHAPIIGARTTEQLTPQLAALGLDLDDDIARSISDLSPTPPSPTDRNEERVIRR